MHTLVMAENRHTEHLLAEIDRMPALADRLERAPAAEIQQDLERLGTFLTEVLIPHVNAQEASLYPELERILQNRHSMKPMLREHAQIRELVETLSAFRLRGATVSTGEALSLRRAIYRLYGLLKVHLAEEQLYAAMLEHNVAEEQAQELALAIRHAGFTEM